MSNTPSLLPCPFCGSKATASVNKDESLWSHDVVDWTRVHCTNDDCNAQTEATCEGYEPSAIEVWNRRTTQPVVREPLTNEQIDVVMRKALGYGLSPSRDDLDFARAIEAEVRKQDDALIREMLESMCWAARVMAISEDEAPGYFAAITAARNRLAPPPPTA